MHLLWSQRQHLYRKVSSIIKNYKNTLPIQAFCSSSATASTTNETDQFKAAVLHPKNLSLKLDILAFPDAAADGMVRIGVDFCAVNCADVKCIKEDMDSVILPFIPGTEYSGEILEVGPKCTRNFKPGDKVAVLSGQKHIGGGLAHQCFAPESECILVDPRLSQRDAAAIIQGYGNALVAYTKYFPLKKDDSIIVVAGPGGNGLAAIEVANKIFKANVYVVFASDDIKGLIRDECAYRAINCNVGLTKVYNVLSSTLKTKKVKAVYDTYNSEILHVVSDFIDKPGGRFLTDDPFFTPETCEAPYFKKDTGKKSKSKKKKSDEMHTDQVINEEVAQTPADDWISSVKKVDFTKFQTTDPEYYEKIVRDVFDLFATEKIDPFISKTWSLRDVNKAIQFVHLNKCLGKVLIEMKRNTKSL